MLIWNMSLLSGFLGKQVCSLREGLGTWTNLVIIFQILNIDSKHVIAFRIARNRPQ